MPREKSKENYHRPSWEEYFMQLVETVGSRGTCDRGRSGCLIVKDKRILATGYVGSAAGMPHCDAVGHDIRKVIDDDGNVSEHCHRTIHAEQNAICQAAKFGIPIEGGTMYIKMEPCSACAKMIVNSGIKRVVCFRKYHAAKETRKIFRQCKVELKVLENKFEEYERQKGFNK